MWVSRGLPVLVLLMSTLFFSSWDVSHAMSHAPCRSFGFGRLYDRGMSLDEYQYQIKSGGTNPGYLVQFKRQHGPHESLENAWITAWLFVNNLRDHQLGMPRS
jgi:hypothetical protein